MTSLTKRQTGKIENDNHKVGPIAAFQRQPSLECRVSVWCYADVWESIVAVLPDEPAFIQVDARLLWRDFDAKANGIAAELLRAGLGQQAKVAVYTQNCAEYLVGYYAAFKAGLIMSNNYINVVLCII